MSSTIYISLGENCVMARQLFLNQMRHNESLPFDWAISNPLSIIEFLTMFMKLDDSEKRIYIERKTKKLTKYTGFANPELFWPHHIDDSDYVIRCTYRLADILREDNIVCFLHFTPLGRLPTHSAMMRLDKAIKLMYPNLKYRIFSLYLSCNDDEARGVNDEGVKDNIAYHRFNVREIWDGDNWSGERNEFGMWKRYLEWVRCEMEKLK